MFTKANIFILLTLFIFVGCVKKDRFQEKPKLLEKRFCATNAKGLNEVYKKIDYKLEKSSIPNLFIKNFSKIWKNKENINKKEIFIKSILPSIIRANMDILHERKKFLKLYRKFPLLFDDEKKYLYNLAKKYKVVYKKFLTKESLDELYKKIDTIPVSLALAQAAIESGWGDSRFVSEGNAFFGQWIFSKKGMIPKKIRVELKSYSVAKFKSIDDSVKAYMLNLNSHFFYKEFRNARFLLKKRGKVDGIKLAKYLKMYSERREDYVKDIIKNY